MAPAQLQQREDTTLRAKFLPHNRPRLQSVIVEKKDFNKVAARILREARNKTERSQVDVALSAGWSQPRLARVESGKANVLIYDLFMLAKALKLDPNKLLREIGKSI